MNAYASLNPRFKTLQRLVILWPESLTALRKSCPECSLASRADFETNRSPFLGHHREKLWTLWYKTAFQRDMQVTSTCHVFSYCGICIND